ncbi:MAG TPA: histidine phosphatase family protein [Gemmatimonadaceae bacterium]|jgi:broad specificity phosphatase PhoE|nr:histidine phosphatase family protein [Gemmatimonadaceae bacterium]
MRLLGRIALVAGLAYVARAGIRSHNASPTIVILVRHADKAATPTIDPPLTAAGETRARDLAHDLKNAGVSAIITTNFIRTKATAAPTAAALSIKPEIVDLPTRDRGHVGAVVAAIRRHTGHTVLVVSHMETAADIVGALGATPPPGMCAWTYDQMYVVTIPPSGAPSVIRTRYGAASPACDRMP